MRCRSRLGYRIDIAVRHRESPCVGIAGTEASSVPLALPVLFPNEERTLAEPVAHEICGIARNAVRNHTFYFRQQPLARTGIPTIETRANFPTACRSALRNRQMTNKARPSEFRHARHQPAESVRSPVSPCAAHRLTGATAAVSRGSHRGSIPEKLPHSPSKAAFPRRHHAEFRIRTVRNCKQWKVGCRFWYKQHPDLSLFQTGK